MARSVFCPKRIQILSWNVRGANDSDKRKIIKVFLKTQRVDVVCLQETKLKETSRGVIRSLGVGRFLDWARINAVGASGGIVILWDSRVLQLIGKEEGHFSVSCRLKNYEDNFRWVFTGVYVQWVVAVGSCSRRN